MVTPMEAIDDFPADFIPAGTEVFVAFDPGTGNGDWVSVTCVHDPESGIMRVIDYQNANSKCTEMAKNSTEIGHFLQCTKVIHR